MKKTVASIMENPNINEEDKEYFIPYLDAKEAFGYEEAELEESFMMIMPDDLYS